METELSKDSRQSLQTKTLSKTSTAAFGLSLAGLFIQAAVAVFLVAVVALASWAYNVLPSSLTADWSLNINLAGFAFYLLYTVIVLGVGFFGAWWLRSSDSSRIKAGAALVLVASLLSVTTVWGLFIGSLLGIVGAIVAFATIEKVTSPILR